MKYFKRGRGTMNNLSELILERNEFLENLIGEKRKKIEKAPKGHINVARSGERVQYYYKKDSKDKKRKYLKKSETPVIAAICQREYDEDVVKRAEIEKKRLEQLLDVYEKGTCEEVYEKLKEERKTFVAPIALSDEEFVSQWLKKAYPAKGFTQDYPEYYTDNGERVRSKSEILIANALKRHNVPYRYEEPLNLPGIGIIHPDFTVLNIRTRQEYYWEHMGKMDDPDYIQHALQRINAYEKNNLFPGKQLILSHETHLRPLSTQKIEQIILQYLK